MPLAGDTLAACRVRMIVSNHAPLTCSVLAVSNAVVVTFRVIMSTRPQRCEREAGLNGQMRNLPAPTVAENLSVAASDRRSATQRMITKCDRTVAGRNARARFGTVPTGLRMQ
jgi:hypothetical protein